MKMSALKAFAVEAARMGLNTLILEWEASFPFARHAVLSNEYAYSIKEISSFLSHCKKLGIDVIPLQQCFGHTEYILRHDRYKELREDPVDIRQVCASKLKPAKKVFNEIFSELTRVHSSPYLHIGGDETRLLGHCSACKEKAEKRGKSALFVDYIRTMTQTVLKVGKRPILWADIILKYPESIGDLPAETVFINWNYGWKNNRFGKIENLLESGFEIWGAPSLRSNPDNHSFTDWIKHFKNIRDYIPFCRQKKMSGIVMTSWSTSGSYGYEFEAESQILTMHAIRRVYPLPGFRILLAAYSEALGNDKKFHSKDFVLRYTQERFDLSMENARQVWHALEVCSKGVNVKNIRSIYREVKNSAAGLKKIIPKKNKKELDHIKLMGDLRKHFLEVLMIEFFIQSPRYTIKKKGETLRKLKRLRSASMNLDKKFLDLNLTFLRPDELQNENRIRNLKLENYFKRLSGV